MPVTLGELAATERCAIYNDLSHMNPRYLTPQRYEPAFHDEEVLFHKRNLLLLSLYFDKIVICTDNLLAFTKYLSKDVVSSVVMSSWFLELVEQRIIILAGWGSSISSDLMGNQADYSNIYRPELKEAKYVQFLTELGERASWVIREAGAGEKEHVDHLVPHLRRLEGVFAAKDVTFLVDLVEQTQDAVGYVGTMEIFPFIEELYGTDAERSDAFYRGYYTSWHEYCACHYAPCIPIHTRRIQLPHARVAVASGGDALAALYSPDIFERYLAQRFGAKVVSRLLAVDVRQLMEIRNGDWARFKVKYHEYILAASSVCWIAFQPHAHELLSDDLIVDELISEIFRKTHHDADLSALGNALDLVLGIALGATGVAPAFALFRKQINKRLGGMLDSVRRRDLEPYLRKLGRVLDTRQELALIPSAR